MGPTSRLRWLLLAAAGIPVLAVTLTPASEIHRIDAGFFCLLCGAGLANIARNVVLFVPLGTALALLLGAGGRAILAALAVTVGVELAQAWIPGRNPLLADILANTAGGTMGVLLVRWAHLWLAPTRRRRAALSLTSALAASGALLAPAFLFSADLPRTTYWGQWTPGLGHLERYEGSVVEASVGGIRVPSWRLEDSGAVREAILAGGPMEVEARAGPPPPGLAPVFSIFDADQREIALLGVDGHDLVGRVRYRADRLGLSRPDLRLEGALRGVDPGDQVVLSFEPRGGAGCLSVGERWECGLGPRAEEGWALLYFPAGLRPPLRRTLSAVWVGLLLMPWGFFARRDALSLVGGVTIAAALVAGWPIASLASPGWPGVVGAVLGALAGRALGRWARRSIRGSSEYGGAAPPLSWQPIRPHDARAQQR